MSGGAYILNTSSEALAGEGLLIRFACGRSDHQPNRHHMRRYSVGIATNSEEGLKPFYQALTLSGLDRCA